MRRLHSILRDKTFQGPEKTQYVSFKQPSLVPDKYMLMVGEICKEKKKKRKTKNKKQKKKQRMSIETSSISFPILHIYVATCNQECSVLCQQLVVLDKYINTFANMK